MLSSVVRRAVATVMNTVWRSVMENACFLAYRPTSSPRSAAGRIHSTVVALMP